MARTKYNIFIEVPAAVHGQPCSFPFILFVRQRKLDESLAFQEFCALINEEESWLTEKIAVQQSEDFGDSLGAVQVQIQYCGW